MEPGGGSRGPCRPADRGPNCAMPPLQAPTPSLCPFLYPSGHAERSPSCPDPKHGCPPAPLSFTGASNGTCHLSLQSFGVPWFNSPVLGQTVSPNPHPSLLPGLLLPPTLPPQDSPRDLPKGQTRHCSFLLRTIHGSPVPLKSRLLTTTFSSLQGFGPSGSPLSTSCPHPHPVVYGPPDELLPAIAHSVPSAWSMPTGTPIHPLGLSSDTSSSRKPSLMPKLGQVPTYLPPGDEFTHLPPGDGFVSLLDGEPLEGRAGAVFITHESQHHTA